MRGSLKDPVAIVGLHFCGLDTQLLRVMQLDLEIVLSSVSEQLLFLLALLKVVCCTVSEDSSTWDELT